MRSRLQDWWQSKGLAPLSRDEFDAARARLLTEPTVPVFWMFGKTGSGKTSLIKHLTRADEATIGTGFRPETRQSRRYDFPSVDHPLLTFLDTRGLGEAGYDPTEDIAAFDSAAHLMIVTVRAADHAQQSIIKPLRAIRQAKPDRPVLLALTALHDLYPGDDHPDPDPFGKSPGDPWQRDRLPADLARSLDEQRRRFEGLVDSVVPLDLTLPDDGFHDPEFGSQRLKRALLDSLPEAYRQTFLTMTDVMSSLKALNERQAKPYVLAAATMAATAAAVPIPWIDIPAVAGLQSDLIRRLAILYGQPLDRDQFLQMAGAVSSRLVIRQAFRGLLKLIPFVGQAANSALAFASTYALGEACCWYYGQKLAGHSPTHAELRAVLNERLSGAENLWAKHHTSPTSSGSNHTVSDETDERSNPLGSADPPHPRVDEP